MLFLTKTVWRAGAISLLTAYAAVSQKDSAVATMTFVPSGQMGGVVGSATSVGSLLVAVTGAPYSGELVTERLQTLADGTHITETVQTTKVYRDSAGRTRTEHQIPPPPGIAVPVQGPAFINIIDPVAGYHYSLQQQNHVAQRMVWGPARLGNGVNPAPAASPLQPAPPPPALSGTALAQGPNGTPRTRRPRPDVIQESLGTETIEGLAAQGTRSTTTYPAGFMGNDRPITTVRESWTSPELKTTVLTKTTDPRSGDSTTRLTNLSQTEPDPALFEVPADYTIEDVALPRAVAR